MQSYQRCFSVSKGTGADRNNMSGMSCPPDPQLSLFVTEMHLTLLINLATLLLYHACGKMSIRCGIFLQQKIFSKVGAYALTFCAVYVIIREEIFGAHEFCAGKDGNTMEQWLMKLREKGEKIFRDAFEKLKIAAMVLCVAGMAASLGLSVYFGIHNVLLGVTVLLGGIVATWLFSMVLYAFAELREDAETVADAYRAAWYEHHADHSAFEQEWEDDMQDMRDGQADWAEPLPDAEPHDPPATD